MESKNNPANKVMLFLRFVVAILSAPVIKESYSNFLAGNINAPTVNLFIFCSSLFLIAVCPWNILAKTFSKIGIFRFQKRAEKADYYPASMIEEHLREEQRKMVERLIKSDPNEREYAEIYDGRLLVLDEAAIEDRYGPALPTPPENLLLELFQSNPKLEFNARGVRKYALENDDFGMLKNFTILGIRSGLRKLARERKLIFGIDASNNPVYKLAAKG